MFRAWFQSVGFGLSVCVSDLGCGSVRFFFWFFCFLFCSSSLVFDGYWLQWQVCGYVVISMVLIVVVAVFWRVNEILFIVVFILFYYSVYIILLC